MIRSAPVVALLLLASNAAGGVARADAASLRHQVEIQAETVHLSDLFAGLQPGQDCDIGPAPAPGSRIVVPPAQLAAIAGEFGVDWLPTSTYQATTIERAARLVTKDEILAALEPTLLSDGAAPDSDISLSAFVSPMLPTEQTGAPDVQTLDYDQISGRFSATLLFAAAGTEPITLRVVGRAQARTSVLALTHSLPAGTVLSAADLHVVRVATSTVHGSPVVAADEAVGLSLRRAMSESAPLLREMLFRPMLVERGRQVVLKVEGSGITLTAAGTALEAGAAGDRIRVINALSRAILVGQISGNGQVQIDPGTTPVTLSPSAMQPGLPQLVSNTSRYAGDLGSAMPGMASP